MVWQSGRTEPIHEELETDFEPDTQEECSAAWLQNLPSKIPPTDPFWQPKYYPFNLYSLAKAEEKLNYMHKQPCDRRTCETGC